MSEGNGHVRVGNGAGGDRPDRGAGAGGEAAPVTTGSDDDVLPRVPRPGPAALVALALAAFAFGGWQVATWRVGEGSVVPCEAFTPNPDLWDAAVFRGDDGDRPAVARISWNAALRETAGTARCADLVGRSERDVRLLLGEPTRQGSDDGPATRGDEAIWSFTRVVEGATERRLETTAVVVRFTGGQAASVRTSRTRRANS